MPMNEQELDELRFWHEGAYPLYEKLAAYVAGLLNVVLSDAEVPFLAVTHRAKTTESFIHQEDHDEETLRQPKGR